MAAAVLRGEPRSVYRRTKCSAESYGFSLDGVDIVTECASLRVFLAAPRNDERQGKSATLTAQLPASIPARSPPSLLLTCRAAYFLSRALPSAFLHFVTFTSFDVWRCDMQHPPLSSNSLRQLCT